MNTHVYLPFLSAYLRKINNISTISYNLQPSTFHQSSQRCLGNSPHGSGSVPCKLHCTGAVLWLSLSQEQSSILFEVSQWFCKFLLHLDLSVSLSRHRLALLQRLMQFPCVPASCMSQPVSLLLTLFFPGRCQPPVISIRNLPFVITL